MTASLKNFDMLLTDGFYQTMGISLAGINCKSGEKVEMDLEIAMVAEARH